MINISSRFNSASQLGKLTQQPTFGIRPYWSKASSSSSSGPMTRGDWILAGLLALLLGGAAVQCNKAANRDKALNENMITVARQNHQEELLRALIATSNSNKTSFTMPANHSVQEMYHSLMNTQQCSCVKGKASFKRFDKELYPLKLEKFVAHIRFLNPLLSITDSTSIITKGTFVQLLAN